jgi:hypothetical protein
VNAHPPQVPMADGAARDCLLCATREPLVLQGKSRHMDGSCRLRLKANSACARTETTYILS